MILEHFQENERFKKALGLKHVDFFGGGGSPPPAPDPVVTANAQAAANEKTAITQAALNRVDEFTPFGSRVFSPSGEGAFDQSGFDAATTKFNSDLEAFNAQPAGTTTVIPQTQLGEGEEGGALGPGRTIFTPGGPLTSPIAVNRDDFFTPADPLKFKSVTSLSPKGQEAFDAEQDVTLGTNKLAADQIGRIEDAVSNPFNFEGIPDAPQVNGESRNRIEDALFERQTRFLNPQFEQEQRALETQLANQGIPRDSEAFRTELANFNLRKDSVFNDAINTAIAGGGAEEGRLFGLKGSARDRGIQERSFERNIPINEIGALLGTGQVGIPQFGAPAQVGVGATDFLGAVGLQQSSLNNAFNATQRTAASNNSAAVGLGGAALGAGALVIF